MVSTYVPRKAPTGLLAGGVMTTSASNGLLVWKDRRACRNVVGLRKEAAGRVEAMVRSAVGILAAIMSKRWVGL